MARRKRHSAGEKSYGARFMKAILHSGFITLPLKGDVPLSCDTKVRGMEEERGKKS